LFIALDRNTALSLLIKLGYELAKENGTTGFLEQVYEFTKLHPYFTVEHDEETRFLAFNNCVLDTQTWDIYKNDGSIFVTSKITCDYLCDNVYPTPVWDKFLDDISHGDEALKTLIMEVLGYYISPDMGAQIFAIFCGRAATGKSALGNFKQDYLTKRRYPV
jgi:phage/plasmid-associated DNA primase